MSFLVRPATVADLDAIARVQAASPEAAQWPPADYLNYLSFVATPVADESSRAVLGFLAARAVVVLENEAEYELLNLAVDPAARRQGVADVLLQHLFGHTPPAAWYLEVRASNGPAIRLYERHGFRPAGVRPGYYKGPKDSPERAIVMRR